MWTLLRRLVASGAAYQAASLVSAAVALVTLPVYTRFLSRADYGVAETLLTYLILASIVLRLGVGEAVVRLWFDDEDAERRRAAARSATGWVLTATTVAALAGLAVAGPLGELLVDRDDAVLMGFALLGLWAFANLELAQALLRVQERRREYLAASLVNVALTVALTLTLVVGFDAGARGYLAGNYVASTLVLLALWWRLRDLVALRPRRRLGELVRFGGPTVPADAAVFALNVVDRAYLLKTQGAAAAGSYALAVKLSTAVIIAVRGFQLAWPPLAYGVRDDATARRLYATVTTWYVVAAGTVVVALTLLGRWLVRLMDPSYFAAHRALPWVALGWAAYGLVLVLVVIAGRAKVTTRNAPAAAAGLAVNVVLLVLLVPPLGIAGAGIALGGGYVAMLAVLFVLVRRLFPVPFEWGRMAHAAGVLAGVAVAGELLLATDGLGGLAARAGALAAAPLLLGLTGFLRPAERARLRGLLARR